MSEISSLPQPQSWLIRISEVFSGITPELISDFGGQLSKKLGSEYFLIQTERPETIYVSDAAKFLRWNLPVHHAWPCNPEKMEGFVEKAAQALCQKFAPHAPQAIFIGQLDPSSSTRYYKALASNLRGRTLQLFPPAVAALKDAENQDAQRPSLYCLIGKEGLFCGLHSPKQANGFYPGGTKYISQNSPDTISRAGAKAAEALHYLRLHHAPLKVNTHWLELGASPGGMTSELLNRNFRVTAIDRAPLDPRLASHPLLQFAALDVASFKPNSRMTYGAILCDMNGNTHDSIYQVTRLSQHLESGGLVIFTLKTAGVTSYPALNTLYAETLEMAEKASLQRLATTHLTYNRHELTVFFVKI